MKFYRTNFVFLIVNSLFCIFFFYSIVISQNLPNSNLNELQNNRTGLNLIHQGDVVDVDVIGSIEYDWRGTLTPEGFLRGFDTIEDKIYAQCQSEEDLARMIEKSYSKTLRNPQVVVKIVDRSNRPTTVVLGAVRKPQKFQIKRAVTLNEILVLVGGFNEMFSGEIEIVRPANLSCGEPIDRKIDSEGRERYVKSSQDNGTQFINIRIIDLLSGKKEANIQILSGDVLTVTESKTIYVIGGVGTPKQIPYRSELTLSRAIASAGGLSKDGRPDKITIFRRQGSNTSIISADLEKIKTNEAEDVLLKAFDIVDVAQKGREPRTFPPVLSIFDEEKFDISKMPIKIIE